MRIRRLALAATAAATTLALTACGAGTSEPGSTEGGAAPAEGADLTVQVADGSEVTLESTPERVVVLDYASLDTINAIGAGDAVVGVPQKTLPESLAEYKDTIDVGTLKETNFEAVAEANPDLIIISGRQADNQAKFEEIAPTINLAADPSKFIESSITRIEDLAGLFGKHDEVAEKIDALRAQVDELKADAEKAGPTMFVMSSGGKLSTYGPGSRYGFIYDELGFTPAAEDIKNDDGHGQEISFEYVAEKNPDTMLVIDRDAAIGKSGQAAQQVLDNDLVKSTNAAKNGHITYLDGVNWYLVTGGLETLPSLLTELSGSLS